jgi:rhodanese-related sulfurtransferase
MKELEKTKRISISAVLFLLVILVAILTFKKPKHVFDKNSKTTLEEVVSKDYIVSLDALNAMNPGTYALIDIRSNFEFAKGHFENATNISTNQLLEDNSIEFFNTLKSTNKTAILYGKNADEANSAWMLLYQLGYENVKILSVLAGSENNKFQATNYSIEKPIVNYAEEMRLAKEKSKTVEELEAPKVEVKKAAPKKVIPVQKKKKRAPEGGC